MKIWTVMVKIKLERKKKHSHTQYIERLIQIIFGFKKEIMRRWQNKGIQCVNMRYYYKWCINFVFGFNFFFFFQILLCFFRSNRTYSIHKVYTLYIYSLSWKPSMKQTNKILLHTYTQYSIYTFKYIWKKKSK